MSSDLAGVVGTEDEMSLELTNPKTQQIEEDEDEREA